MPINRILAISRGFHVAPSAANTPTMFTNLRFQLMRSMIAEHSSWLVEEDIFRQSLVWYDKTALRATQA